MVSDDRRAELARFLRDRRARLRPEDVGLPTTSRRRVPGLRREEVAALSGVGVTWYTMLESGAEMNVSLATLTSIGSALRFTADELTYAQQLATSIDAETPDLLADPLATRTLDSLAIPAYVCTSQWIALAWNRAFSETWGIEAPGGAPFNIVLRMWSPELRALHGDRFPAFAARVVAMLRAGSARHVHDSPFRAIASALANDRDFAEASAAYEITAPFAVARTTIDSPTRGRFTYETMTLVVPHASGQAIVVQVPVEGVDLGDRASGDAREP